MDALTWMIENEVAVMGYPNPLFSPKKRKGDQRGRILELGVSYSIITDSVSVGSKDYV